MVKLYSEIRLRDHVVWIKKGAPTVGTFNGEKIEYNVQLHFLEGIALHMTRAEGKAKTHEPYLTIHVDPKVDGAVLERLPLPENIILKGDFGKVPVKGRKREPTRKLWHAEVQFDDGAPAVDFEGGIQTEVAMWEEGEEHPIYLGKVNHEGFWNAAFSDAEIESLDRGEGWLTLTAGNFLTRPDRDHQKLGLRSLSPDRGKLEPVVIAKPRYYWGRILFDDGSPPVLDPLPWPGAEVSVSFPFAGAVNPDKEGYFKVFFTAEQFAEMNARKVRKNVYIPSFERKGSSTAIYAYPATDLSQEKEKAGELRIAKPMPKKKDDK